jgi:putative oxidoreductase
MSFRHGQSSYKLEVVMDVGILLVRLTVGLTLAAHGGQKVFGWFGGSGLTGFGHFLESLGFRPGRLHALAAGAAEVAGGLLLAAGLLTPLGAALAASVMLVAAATVHVKNGFFAANGGYEFNLVLGIAALAVAFSGPGALSVDALAGLETGGLGWGAAAALVALVGAAGQLAQRRPSTDGSPFGNEGTTADSPAR